MEKGSTVIDAGAVNIAMEYRDDIMNDQGLCVQVYAEVEGKDTEILRFDCFDQDPHYHYGPENLNIRLFMDKTTAGNPLGWTMSQLRDKLPVMVERSGYDDLADKLRDNPVSSSVFDKTEKQGRELSRTGRRTVTHMFERQLEKDLFEAGNIRFGLEYRLLPQINSEGMAIHVMSDVAGQNVELLAFDCFDNGPHYHYGPRNQDIRIYWDTTVTPEKETLRWTLDQFKAGNLRKMIERAGYPSIANSLDENLIQAILPDIERRSFELVAENKTAQAAPGDGKKTKAQLIQELEALREQVAAL